LPGNFCRRDVPINASPTIKAPKIVVFSATDLLAFFPPPPNERAKKGFLDEEGEIGSIHINEN